MNIPYIVNSSMRNIFILGQANTLLLLHVKEYSSRKGQYYLNLFFILFILNQSISFSHIEHSVPNLNEAFSVFPE